MELVNLCIDKNTGRVVLPKGCDDCKEVRTCKDCGWVENSWKYDEINKFFTLAIYKESGFDLNRFPILPSDFIKIKFLRKYL